MSYSFSPATPVNPEPNNDFIPEEGDEDEEYSLNDVNLEEFTPDARAPAHASSGAKPYVISKVHERKVLKFGVEEIRYRARFNLDSEQPITNFQDHLHGMFEDVLAQARQNMSPQDRMRLHISHESLETPITVHLQPNNLITANTILER